MADLGNLEFLLLRSLSMVRPYTIAHARVLVAFDGIVSECAAIANFLDSLSPEQRKLYRRFEAEVGMMLSHTRAAVEAMP